LPKKTSEISVDIATTADARAMVALQNAAGEELTRLHGKGVWSWKASEGGLCHALGRPKFFRALVAHAGAEMVGTLHLATKKPWAIDAKYFTNVAKPLYLAGMAMRPGWQGIGVGRILLNEAEIAARAWPADAIRLDAFDGQMGAGEFYAKCGYREVARVRYKTSSLTYYELILQPKS
jgi:GNAT superfamily N-acetyltransferase